MATLADAFGRGAVMRERENFTLTQDQFAGIEKSCGLRFEAHERSNLSRLFWDAEIGVSHHVRVPVLTAADRKNLRELARLVHKLDRVVESLRSSPSGQIALERLEPKVLSDLGLLSGLSIVGWAHQVELQLASTECRKRGQRHNKGNIAILDSLRVVFEGAKRRLSPAGRKQASFTRFVYAFTSLSPQLKRDFPSATGAVRTLQSNMNRCGKLKRKDRVKTD